LTKKKKKFGAKKPNREMAAFANSRNAMGVPVTGGKKGPK